VIFSNNDTDSVRRISRIMSESVIDQIIWAVEGGQSMKEFLERLDPKRNIIVYNGKRLGKAAAYNNVFDIISGDLVFLISSDIVFDPEIFQKIKPYFENHDLLIPSVKASHCDGPVRKVSGLLWDIRNTELQFLNENGAVIHGGEFIAIRKSFLTRIPDVVNEDALQCITAQQNGARVIFAEDVVVRNFVPSKLSDFIEQRRRINFGYIQLKRMGFKPQVLSFMVTNDFGTFAAILKIFIRKNRKKIVLLFPLAALEVVSRILSATDYFAGRKHKFWKIISTSKS
jgi:cellulose synthase/poly-beta-1,6-N-acetylglucosamine synthase-like glycosyltransferase